MSKKDFNLFGDLKDKFVQLKRMKMGEIPMNILNTMDILYKGKEYRPQLIKDGAKQYKGGWHFVFTLNPGCNFDDVYKNIGYFKSVVKGNVEMKLEDKFLHIDVNDFEFKKVYKFNPQHLTETLSKPKYQKMYLPIIIGIKSGGKLLIEDIAEMPHILVAGINKSGKSSWIKQLLYGVALTRPDVIIIYMDFKGADAWTISPIGFTAIETNEALDLFYQLKNEVDKRQKFIREHRISKIHKYRNIPPILLAIDEITDMNDKECQDILNYLLRKARNTGTSIIAGTQKPSHKTYKDFCESRSQFEARMAFRLSEAKDSHMVLNNHKAYEFIKPKQEGRGIWQFGDDEVIQSLFIDDDDIYNILGSGNPNINHRTREVKKYAQIKEQNLWLLP